MTTSEQGDLPDPLTGFIDVRIGEAVMLHMFRQKMKQGTLAAELHISQSALSRKLRGYTGWSLFDLFQAARTLSVPAVDLLPAESYWLLFGDQPAADAAVIAMRACRDSNPKPSDLESARRRRRVAAVNRRLSLVGQVAA